MTLVTDGKKDFIQEKPLQWRFAVVRKTQLKSKYSKDKYGFVDKEQSDKSVYGKFLRGNIRDMRNSS
jgi:hypothetical protein